MVAKKPLLRSLNRIKRVRGSSTYYFVLVCFWGVRKKCALIINIIHMNIYMIPPTNHPPSQPPNQPTCSVVARSSRPVCRVARAPACFSLRTKSLRTLWLCVLIVVVVVVVVVMVVEWNGWGGFGWFWRMGGRGETVSEPESESELTDIYPHTDRHQSMPSNQTHLPG